MTENLLRYNNKQIFCFWDFETESLNNVISRPWQMGLLVATNKEILDRIEKKIWWPDLNISADAALITRFDREQYEREAIDSKEALQIFENIIYDPNIINVGQNTLAFDCYQHNTWRKVSGFSTDYSYINRAFDTKAIFAAIMKDSKCPLKNDLLSWQYAHLNMREKGLKTSLAHQMKHFGLVYDADKHHDALVDVGYTREVFRKQLWQVEI